MAVLNLTTLRTELGNKIKKPSITNDRKDRWLNMAVDDVCRAIDADHLVDETPITTASGIRLYFVPDCQPSGIIQIVDTTNDKILSKLDEEDVERIDPDRDDAGDARFYNGYKYSEYEGVPLTASTVDIVSSTADTAQVRITGTVSGVLDTELLTLNGANVVTGTKSFSAIHGVRKATTTTGKVTVNVNDASNTVIANIAPSALIRQYQPFRVWNVPDAADSLRVRFYRLTRPMINAEDIPDVSSDEFHELVLIAAAIRGHRDLFDHDIAEKVQVAEWGPFIQQFAKKQGKNRTDRSPVIGGSNADQFQDTMLGGRYGYPVDF
jgi:hypothetical protein